jgi:hypothetical protein
LFPRSTSLLQIHEGVYCHGGLPLSIIASTAQLLLPVSKRSDPATAPDPIATRTCETRTAGRYISLRIFLKTMTNYMSEVQGEDMYPERMTHSSMKRSCSRLATSARMLACEDHEVAVYVLPVLLDQGNQRLPSYMAVAPQLISELSLRSGNILLICCLCLPKGTTLRYPLIKLSPCFSHALAVRFGSRG